MKMQESAEMYLETILVLAHKKPQVRSVDIADELQFKKSSVSVAMKKLRESGCIEMDREGYITLTDAGQRIAARVYERHRVLRAFFVALGVDARVAAEDACRVEHDLSEETFEKLLAHARAIAGEPDKTE